MEIQEREDGPVRGRVWYRGRRRRQEAEYGGSRTVDVIHKYLPSPAPCPLRLLYASSDTVSCPLIVAASVSVFWPAMMMMVFSNALDA